MAGRIRESERRTGRLTRSALALLLSVVVVTGVGAYPVLRGWTRPPTDLAESTVHHVAEARAARAAEYAPTLLASAETALAAGNAEYLRQVGRLISFRNFGRARDAYACASSKALAAREAAVHGADTRKTDAKTTLRQASITLTRAEACGAALTGSGRASLSRARSLLAEARSLYESGAFMGSIDCSLRSMRAAARTCSKAAELASRFLDKESIRTWRRWIDETVRESRAGGRPAILVIKETNQLVLLERGTPARTYRVDLGVNRLHRKLRAGDMATPEGRYHITAKKGPGESQYYLALLLDYPNEADRARLRRAKQQGGVAPGSGQGGDIEIHGEGGRGSDWTRGCIALANDDMKELFGRVSNGTPVTIVGSDGNGGPISNLAREIEDGTRGEGSP